VQVLVRLAVLLEHLERHLVLVLLELLVQKSQVLVVQIVEQRFRRSRRCSLFDCNWCIRW